ncbi:glutamate receptor 2-like isoform X1 [Tachypleus tridentatus]|uniref:glutamate receptor 2-like isoform X1 n=1 Tax=Tachypleus tridentatus TaxID=6853 RepID=UPI003FD69DC8
MGSRGLRVGVAQWFPWVDVFNRNGTVTIGGPMAEIFEYLSSSMNYSFTYVTPISGITGGRLPNGSYSGAIGLLHRNEADLAVGPFTATYERSQISEFTDPIYVDYLTVLTGVPQNSKNIFSYLTAFEWKVWLAMFSALFLMAVTSTIMEGVIKKERRCSIYRFLSFLWNFYRSLWNQGLTRLPELVTMRLLLASWLLAVLVFMASFGGHLRSTLLLEKQNDHIRNLDDVLRFPNVQPLLESGSSAEALFRSGSHPTYKAIWKRISGKIASRIPLDDLLSEETLDKVEHGSHIVITEVSSLVGGLAKRYEKKKTCSYYISDIFFPKNMVIIMRKNLSNTLQREVKKRVARFYPIGVVKHRVMDRTSNSENVYTHIKPPPV